ncbi:RNA polymerase sigma factor [Ktedonosporobacter rubrisoli]|uniref:RNA polymerase sigma factor n=1 Tax=Ktedonosporobacter rubrisoli TaxID=2509675 RepID=A0A4P6K271_KTERU|nr:RNA polymerase sigma factor [Ktedonosporobacter rubrisoli]QBD81933.1 RNA polymerase sigma factor [Ktedonosporobacter rubrisoli]
MDTSIRFYNTNSSLHSSLEEDERPGHSAMPLPKDEGSSEETGYESEEDAEAHSTHSAAAGSEQLQPAEQVNVADFESIFQRFQVPITNFIYHLIGNREQAYDLAQDVFVKAYKALLGGTVVQPAALSAWLYRIAANTTTDSLRRRRLISWLPLSLFNEDRGIGAGVISDSGGTSADNFNSNGDEHAHEARASSVSTIYERGGYDGGRFESRVADREIVERVLKQMPPKYAVCLWLYENDGFSCAEIAGILSISSSAVKMRLMRARERFIGLYKKEVGED